MVKKIKDIPRIVSANVLNLLVSINSIFTSSITTKKKFATFIGTSYRSHKNVFQNFTGTIYKEKYEMGKNQINIVEL